MSGNIRCAEGASVGFELVALGKTVQVNSTCNSNVDLKIRQKLLESLDGRILTRTISGAQTGVGYHLDFSGTPFAFNQPIAVREENQTTAGITRACYVDYTFDYSTGKLIVDLRSNRAGGAWKLNEQANIDFNSAVPGTIADPANNPGDSDGCNTASTANYGTIDFRFKDGKIETDESNRKDFNPNGCVLWDEVTGDLLDYKIKNTSEVCSIFWSSLFYFI